jgi:hypothetical protein
MRWLLLLVLTACGNASGPEAIARCLTDKGVRMYGAFWCSHCAQQKAELGDAFRFVTYVECSNSDYSQNQTCKDALIEGYPTWVFPDESRLQGEQTLSALQAKAGC